MDVVRLFPSPATPHLSVRAETLLLLKHILALSDEQFAARFKSMSGPNLSAMMAGDTAVPLPVVTEALQVFNADFAAMQTMLASIRSRRKDPDWPLSRHGLVRLN